MIHIPLTQAVVITAKERKALAADLMEAALALEESAKLNRSLLLDVFAANAKVKEYAGMLVSQADVMGQIMQINSLVSGAMGRIREGEDAETVIEALEASLSEFGGSPVGGAPDGDA